MVRAKVTPPPGGQAWAVERVFMLTPYAADTVAAEARRLGPGACLEITVPSKTTATGLVATESLFAWLRERGVEVTVLRSDDESWN